MDFSQKIQANSEGVIVPASHDMPELLASLPKETAWGDDLYQYQGFWYSSPYLEAALSCKKHFQARDTDMFVVTPPKSGTTWLISLVFAITRRTQHPPSDLAHPLLKANPHELVPALETVYRINNNPDLSHIVSPRPFSTHFPSNLLPDSVKTNRNCRIIYLCRNPKDTFVSLWHFMNKTIMPPQSDAYPIPLEEAFEHFCKGVSLIGPLWDHAVEYWNMSLTQPERVLFLRYEDLQRDTVCQVKKIGAFLGFPFSSEEESDGVIEGISKLCSFKHISNLDVNKNGITNSFEHKHLFRKGEVGDWMNHMTPSMGEQLDKIVQKKLLGSGLEFI